MLRVVQFRARTTSCRSGSIGNTRLFTIHAPSHHLKGRKAVHYGWEFTCQDNACSDTRILGFALNQAILYYSRFLHNALQSPNSNHASPFPSILLVDIGTFVNLISLANDVRRAMFSVLRLCLGWQETQG
jgi:hypothetical protein